MTPTVYVLNGPNLNMLGKREPDLYGAVTLDQVRQRCEAVAAGLGLSVFFAQTNAEFKLIDWLHEAREQGAGVIINPAGLSFRSIPLLDALKIVEKPIIEVHVTNIHRREELYQHSLVSRVATTVIAGAGTFGYELALQAIRRDIDNEHA